MEALLCDVKISVAMAWIHIDRHCSDPTKFVTAFIPCIFFQELSLFELESQVLLTEAKAVECCGDFFPFSSGNNF